MARIIALDEHAGIILATGGKTRGDCYQVPRGPLPVTSDNWFGVRIFMGSAGDCAVLDMAPDIFPRWEPNIAT